MKFFKEMTIKRVYYIINTYWDWEWEQNKGLNNIPPNAIIINLTSEEIAITK